jgi:sugar phosphate isomerase/epimerase
MRGSPAASITGFTDEIAADLATQLRAAKRIGLDGIDVRSIGGNNVLTLTDKQLAEVATLCFDHGLKVHSVGSPVNKVHYSEGARAEENCKLERAIEAAKLLGTRRIRVFTPSLDDQPAPEEWPAVREWMAEQIAVARASGMVLCHENVPAGQGDGQIAETLAWLDGQGWRGGVVLEPHLAEAGDHGGFTGEARFREATDAIRTILDKVRGG